eukprot:CAMPEP_0184718440 /NCGR_PEP_ID=MMETSP0314-20130426/7634_1 /TAXON_ID=38298 /ORGANISM="Rhodella maculata, Strain CCMP 736" /LENGTH=50 /DNA_ID=CAMNT_0027182183 /DNA_START=84 /DNA_END=233 /DNA_ORIENTATION=+
MAAGVTRPRHNKHKALPRGARTMMNGHFGTANSDPAAAQLGRSARSARRS